MKKVFCLLILLAAAGVVFFAGWVQLQVPPGSYGVLRSKTHGTDPSVIVEGKFRWIWYKLIPTNVTVQVFKVPEISVPIDVSGTLSSGDTYAAFTGIKADFSYALSGRVSAFIKPESLPAWAEQYNLGGQEDLDAQVQRLSGDIETFARQRLWSYAENEAALEEARMTGTISKLDADLAAAFPQTDRISCSLSALRFPDLALYREARGLYQEYMASQKNLYRDILSQNAARSLGTRLRFDELALYGELLTKYPVLLQYLALEKGLTPAGIP